MGSFSSLRKHFNFPCRFSSVVGGYVRLASTFKAAVLQKAGEPLEIADVNPVKKLKKGQVRIDVRYCAVNTVDLLMCNGVIPQKVPFTPGFELSGEVLEIKSEAKDDDELGIHVGDKVLSLSRDMMGGFSHQCIVDEKDVWKLPQSVNYETGAAVGYSYATALLGLTRLGKVKEKSTVLITAAGGGLGLAAVDLASNVYKAKVVALCGSEQRAEVVRNKGVWSTLTWTTAKALCDGVNSVTDNKGVNIVFDSVGGVVFMAALNCVAHEGTAIVASHAAQTLSDDVPLKELLLHPTFFLTGISLRQYRESAFNIYRQSVSDVLEMCEERMIQPCISESVPLIGVNEAIQHIAENKTIGKVLICIKK